MSESTTKDKVIERLIGDLEQRDAVIEVLRNENARLNRKLVELERDVPDVPFGKLP